MTSARSWRCGLPYFLITTQRMISGASIDLQFLSNGSRCFCGTGSLDSDDLDQVNKSRQVILIVLLAGHAVYLNRNRGVRLSRLDMSGRTFLMISARIIGQVRI